MSALLPNTSANATATAIVDTSGDLLWVEIVLLALVILATVNVVFLCASGNLLTWKDKDHEDMQCRPQCGLSIFPKLGKRLVRAAQVADKYTTQEAAKGVVVAATLLTNLAAQLKKAMLCKAEGTLAKACYAPRRQFSVEIRTLLDDITLPARSKAIATAEEKGAESDEAVRATDEADTLDSICDAAHAAATEVLVETANGEKINVPSVCIRAVEAALRVPRLGHTLGSLAELSLADALQSKLPASVAGGITATTNLRAVVANVWGRLLPRIVDDARFASVLRRIINSLIDAKALQPINTLWLRVVIVSGVWIGLVGGGWFFFLWLVEGSRLEGTIDRLTTHFSNTYQALMVALVVVVVVLQIKLVEMFLKKRASMITHELITSIERTLLGLLSDTEVLGFIRDILDTAVESLIVELAGEDPHEEEEQLRKKEEDDMFSKVGRFLGFQLSEDWCLRNAVIANPLRSAYAAWGGTDEIMRIIDEKTRNEIRPSIVKAFDPLLERSEDEAAAAMAIVMSDSFDPTQLEHAGSDQTRLDRVLLELNEVINKHAVEVADRGGRRIGRGVNAGINAGINVGMNAALRGKISTKVDATKAAAPSAMAPAPSVGVQKV